MPVTFCPAALKTEAVDAARLKERTPEDILQASCPAQYKQCDRILQTSFSAPHGPVLSCSNGLVHAICEAYNHHRALEIRPDDVWLAILIQFSFYVNAHAEELRTQFVAHTGQKHLKIESPTAFSELDFGWLATEFAHMLEENVVDPELRAWIVPAFSTTTLTDVVVGSVIMMASMKKYFTYECFLACGIPRVTLAGDKDDWEEVAARAEKLGQYGEQPTQWLELLRPVLSRFVRAFDDPHGKDNLHFWGRPAHLDSHSGGNILSGWVTAFCVFDADGKWLGFSTKPAGGYGLLCLDGVYYHNIDYDDVPPAAVEVDVKLNDEGDITNTVMTGGLVGMSVQDSSTVKPLVGWWIFAKPERKQNYGARTTTVSVPRPTTSWTELIRTLRTLVTRPSRP